MEDESFNPVAQSRANYYTPGSPVQFVRVELLRGDQSGDNAVCLTFKNISQQQLNGLKVRFKCKGADGTVLCEDTFDYDALAEDTGSLFGMDDAVFVTQESIGSVDVVLLRAVYGRQNISLEEFRRVRLPGVKKLPAEMAARLQAQIGKPELKYMPQVLENGWYCACGAFHPKEENTVYCSECGSDRILLQNAISNLMQPSAPAEEPTRVAAPHVDEPTRVAGAAERGFREPEDDEGRTREVSAAPYAAAPTQAEHFREAYRAPAPQHEPEEDPRDVQAENIIRWVPAVTALLCAAIALGGFVYCQIIL